MVRDEWGKAKTQRGSHRATKAIAAEAGRGQERELVPVVEALKAVQKGFGLGLGY